MTRCSGVYDTGERRRDHSGGGVRSGPCYRRNLYDENKDVVRKRKTDLTRKVVIGVPNEGVEEVLKRVYSGKFIGGTSGETLEVRVVRGKR